MGTSNIFNGKNDTRILLPDDYDNPASIDTHQLGPGVTWKTVKSDMSKYIKSDRKYSSPKHIIRQYIRASGGSHRMVTHSRSGMIAGANFGSFLHGIQTNGIADTLGKLGVQYIGKPLTDVFSKLVSIIAPKSDSKEDIIAKEATQAAFVGIYDYIEKNNMDLNCLDQMPSDLPNQAIQEFIGSYIWGTIMNDLGSRLEMYIAQGDNAYAVEQEFKGLIMGIVDVEIGKMGDTLNLDAGSCIKELYTKCLKVLEGIV